MTRHVVVVIETKTTIFQVDGAADSTDAHNILEAYLTEKSQPYGDRVHLIAKPRTARTVRVGPIGRTEPRTRGRS